MVSRYIDAFARRFLQVRATSSVLLVKCNRDVREIPLPRRHQYRRFDGVMTTCVSGKLACLSTDRPGAGSCPPTMFASPPSTFTQTSQRLLALGKNLAFPDMNFLYRRYLGSKFDRER